MVFSNYSNIPLGGIVVPQVVLEPEKPVYRYPTVYFPGVCLQNVSMFGAHLRLLRELALPIDWQDVDSISVCICVRI